MEVALLTLPGGFVVWFAKKDNLISKNHIFNTFTFIIVIIFRVYKDMYRSTIPSFIKFYILHSTNNILD